MGSGGISLH